MRLLISAAAAAGLLAGPICATAAAESCARPYEMQAFDVEGLKSELMVVAISCQVQDRYNGFITRYQRELQMHERAINGYFARTSGHRAQQMHDDYITNLANVQSESGIQQGTLFCAQRLPMFDEVMALGSPKELPGYAESKSLARPPGISVCAEPEKKKKKVTAAADSK